MNSPFQPKKLNVPGLLGDDALNDSLKQFSNTQNALQSAAPAPDSAVDMVDRIQNEYLKAPSPSIRGVTAALPGPLGLLAGAVGDAANQQPAGPAPVDPQQRAVDVRSSILSDAAAAIPAPLRDFVLGPVVGELGQGGAINALGTLTPEQSQAEADQRAKDAQANEAAVRDHAAVRDKLRGLTDDQAAAMGLPVAPGGTPPEAKVEAAKNDAGIIAEAAKRNQEAIAATKDPALQPKQTWWLNAMQSGAQGAAQMGIGSVRFATELAEMTRDVSGVGLLTGGGRSNARAWIDTVDAALTKMLPGDKARSKDFVTQLSQGAGSMLGFMMAGFAGASAEIPVAVSTAALGAASQGDQQFQDAEKFNATGLQKYMSLLLGAGLGLTEALPIDRMFMRADAATGGLVRRMLTSTAAGSIQEFTQEFGQAVGQDVIAKLTYDEKRKMDWGSYLQQGLVGAITGGLADAAVHVMHETGVSPHPADATPPEQRQQIAQQVIDSITAELNKLPGMSEHEAALAAEAAPTNAAQPQPGEQNAAAVPADNAPLVDISPDVAAQIMPRESVQPEQAATSVPVGRDASGKELVVPPEVFANQTRAVTETPAFKSWFGDSKVVDDGGAPQVLYHGLSSRVDTSSGFAFDKAKIGSSTDEGWLGKGFYFTPKEDVAQAYGDQVLPVYLSLKNPFVFPDDVNPIKFVKDKGGSQEFTDWAKAQGYDGVVSNNVLKQTVAFEPTQIKSAFNGGNFDPNNPDILANQGTATNRNVMAGEQTRPAAGIATTPAAGNSDVSLAQISQGFTKLLGLTVRQGRFTLKGKDVTGQYDRRTAVVRIKTQNDLSNIVHEAGHDIYFKAGTNLQHFVAANDAALMKVADDLYGGDTNTMPKSTHIAEGFAEFFRVYTLNRAYAETHYPSLVTDFDAVLDKDAPQLKTGLALVGQQYAAWLQLPSAQLIRNMIVSGEKESKINVALQELQDAGFGTWMHEINRRAVDASVNRYAPLNDVVAQILNIGQENKGKAIDLKRADDPRILQRLATNAGARAMVQTTDGVMSYNSTDPSTRGLREALLRYHGKRADQNLFKIDPIRQADFASYLVALRGIDEYRRLAEGKIERPPLAASLGDLQVTVKELEGKYGTDFSEAAKIVHEYAMGLWQKSFDAGLMSEETYNDGLDRQFYAPLQRDMSDKKASLGASALTGSSSLVKRFRGSDRDIVDPMDVLMHKTFALEQIISRNEVFRTLGNLADRAGKVGALVERVPSKQLMGRQLSVKEVARQLTKDDTISAADAQDLMEILQSSIEKENTIDMFRSEPVQTKGENIIFGWEKGRLAALQLADGDLGADVVNVVNGLGRENLPLFTSIISSTTSIFRAGIISWPDFIAANFIKDQFSAFILTDVGYKPFVTGIRGVYDELRQKNWAKQYNGAMGAMGGMNVANLHKARMERDIGALRGKGYIVKAFTGRNHVLTNGIEGFSRMIELTETGTRLGVFKAAYERARKDGLSEWESSVEAAYTATDLMDFGLNGSRMALYRKTIPFLNAQLQGLYKMMRTLGADEVRQRKGLNFVVRAYFKSMNNVDLSRTEKQAINAGRKAWIKMASLGLLSAALHYLFRDDPDYQEASEYLRVTGWVIPLGDGRIFYIPKPYELAVLANFTERALESSEGDKEAMSRFGRGLAMTFGPPMAPPLIKTIVETQLNKDSFTGQEIVPSYMQALAPELQFNNYTSTLAKQLGHLLDMSPMKIDHVMSSLGASAYRDIMSMYNSTDPNRGNMDTTDAPILRRFVRDVRRGSTSSQDFWGIASTLNGTLRSAEVTYRAFLDAGNEHAANDFLNTLDEDSKAYAILNTDFKADAKRLNPFYRARQLTTIVSAMRREMVTPLGLTDTTTKTSPEMKLTAKEKTDLDEALSEYARREMRNTLVAMQAPGWAGKKMVDTKTTMNLIGKIEPRVLDELQRRIDKAKVYDFKTITNYWPEVKNRLLRDRENTFLDDILSVAKVMR